MAKRLLMAFCFLAFVIQVGCSGKDKVGTTFDNASFNLKTVEKRVIGRVPEADITLYATNETDDMYKGLILKYVDNEEKVSWKSVSNPDCKPILMLADLNKDKKDELIVILTTEYGEENSISEAHIIDIENWTEVYIKDPIEKINKEVKTKLTHDIATIDINNKSTKIDIKEYSKDAELYNKIKFGDTINFSVNNNILTAESSAKVAPSVSIGRIFITYEYNGDIYDVKDIIFKPKQVLKTN